MIQYRKLLHSDYDDILDICKDIWDGTDYLPGLFHKWVDDKGFLLGAVDPEKNKVVALGKFSILHDLSGWLEGLRVHKDYRGLKIARTLSEKLIGIGKKELENNTIKKLSFATHITNVESIALMKTLNFKLENQFLIVSKKYETLDETLHLDQFSIKSWDLSYKTFSELPYIKKRNNILPLAFIFENPTIELYNELKESNSFVLINGHPGIFKLKGEPNFIAVEESPEAILTFMNYYLLKFKDKLTSTPMTSVLPQDTTLINALKEIGFISWSNWEPDYLLYSYA